MSDKKNSGAQTRNSVFVEPCKGYRDMLNLRKISFSMKVNLVQRELRQLRQIDRRLLDV